MALTTSLAFPNMFDTARNRVAIFEDNVSIVNRSRLLILTEPTELYNNPQFGVGLKRHLWHYNNEAERAIMRQRITDQLRLHEPCVNPDRTTFTDGLLYTGTGDEQFKQDYQSLKMTVGLQTIYSQETVDVDLGDVES